MTSHTVGPWFAKETAAGKGKVVDAQGFSICNTTAGPYAEQRSNARLIAAAPELLQALEALVAEVAGNAARGNPASVYWGSVTAAQNVINKVCEP